MSASWSVVLTWDTILFFDVTSSRRKWYLVPMCFVLDENTVVSDSRRAPMLASYIYPVKTGKTLIQSSNQKGIPVLGSHFLVRYTPIRMKRVQQQFLSSSSMSLVLLQTCTSYLKRSENCWDRRCGLRQSIVEGWNPSCTSHRDRALCQSVGVHFSRPRHGHPSGCSSPELAEF